MKQSELIAELGVLGWSRQEAELYIALLHLGPQPASHIADSLGRNRLTVFHALKRLCKKGFAETAPHPRGVRFVAIDPHVLLLGLKQKQSDAVTRLQTENAALTWLLPHLKEIESKDVVRPAVQIFHGDDALRRIYALSLKTSSMYAYFEPWPSKTQKRLRKIDDWHTGERVKLGIPVKIIIPDTEEGSSFAAIQKDLKEVAVIPSSQFPFKDITIITDTHMLIYSQADELGIAIESSQIARNQQSIFLLAWLGAKQLAKR